VGLVGPLSTGDSVRPTLLAQTRRPFRLISCLSVKSPRIQSARMTSHSPLLVTLKPKWEKPTETCPVRNDPSDVPRASSDASF
jgi:hypothetical protein